MEGLGACNRKAARLRSTYEGRGIAMPPPAAEQRPGTSAGRTRACKCRRLSWWLEDCTKDTLYDQEGEAEAHWDEHDEKGHSREAPVTDFFP
jgi:hypothetical protein